MWSTDNGNSMPWKRIAKMLKWAAFNQPENILQKTTNSAIDPSKAHSTEPSSEIKDIIVAAAEDAKTQQQTENPSEN